MTEQELDAIRARNTFAGEVANMGESFMLLRAHEDVAALLAEVERLRGEREMTPPEMAAGLLDMIEAGDIQVVARQTVRDLRALALQDEPDDGE